MVDSGVETSRGRSGIEAEKRIVSGRVVSSKSRGGSWFGVGVGGLEEDILVVVECSEGLRASLSPETLRRRLSIGPSPQHVIYINFYDNIGDCSTGIYHQE